MESNRKIYITNPYTQEVVGTVPRASREQTADIFEMASTYIPQLTRHQRQKILMNCSELLNSKKEQISNLITAESGLCKKDSLHEVGRAVNVFSLTAHLCVLDDSETFSCDVSPPEKKRKIFTQREPLKSISAITPFNHPLNMMSHKVAPAIATNNCLVGKPSELTPLTALLLAEILYESGLPPEMFSIVTGYPEEIGEEMITNKHVELITFTGSVPVGKYIAEHAGYRRTVLELGGNSPLIIMEDADLDKAAVLAVQGATNFSGQRCTAVKRVVVVEAIANEFVSLMTKKASRLRCGDPMNPETDVGTVISESAAVLIEDRVNNAINEGAILLYGNRRDGAVYSPTVLDHVPFDCELVQNETFGPTIPVIRVRDIDQAISVSNSTPYGLSSGICTNNLNYIIQFINELKTGTVNVWEVPGYRTEISPFGGIKDSGLGYKEGILETMKSYTNIKTFSLPWA